MQLERRAVGRKTPRDGKLEVTAVTAGHLAHLGHEFTVFALDARAAGRLEELACTCGKGPVEGGHIHHFVVCHLFERLTEGALVDLALDAPQRALRVEPG